MDQPAHISPPPQSSPSPPKASFSSPSFIRPPPTLNSHFYPTPRATPRTKQEEEGRPLDPKEDYSNNWGDEWTEMGCGIDADRDVDEDRDIDEDEFAWDSEKVAGEWTNERACLNRSAKAAASKLIKSVPVNENSLGIARRTLGAGRPKRKALLCSNFVENDGETSAAGAGGVVGGSVVASSAGSPSLGIGSAHGPAAPITQSQSSQRTIFRLGTSTSFKKIRRVPPKLKMTEVHPTPHPEDHADFEALGNDEETKIAAPDADDSTSKGEGSSTQINVGSAEAKVKIKTEALDETAVKGDLTSRVEDDDDANDHSTTNAASSSNVKKEKVKTQVA